MDRHRDEEPEQSPAERRRAVNREIVKFVLVFLGVLVVMYGSYLNYRQSAWMERYLEVVCVPVVWCLKPIAESVTRDGTSIRYNDFGMSVVADCSAIPSMSIFTAAVIAFPATWRRRFLGLLLGIPFLFMVNVLRLTCLAVIGDNEPFLERMLGFKGVFDFAHVYVWQSIFIIFVIGIWLLWVEKFAKSPAESSTEKQ